MNKNYFDEWLNLRYELWPYHTKDELKAEMMEIFKDKENKATFIAINDDNEVCGFIELSIKKEAPGCYTSKIGFIEGWYVRPKYRQQGVGKLLVQTGETWAKIKGCLEMASDTTIDYELSPKAHLALGYEEVNMPLHYKKKI